MAHADGGAHQHRHRTGRTGGAAQGSASGGYNAPNNGYNSPSPNDGGIFGSGYQSDDANFGNQYSASAQAQYGENGLDQYASSDDASDSNIAMLEKAVPGVPGEDYPIYAEVPETAFACDGQVDGGKFQSLFLKSCLHRSHIKLNFF